MKSVLRQEQTLHVHYTKYLTICIKKQASFRQKTSSLLQDMTTFSVYKSQENVAICDYDNGHGDLRSYPTQSYRIPAKNVF